MSVSKQARLHEQRAGSELNRMERGRERRGETSKEGTEVNANKGEKREGSNRVGIGYLCEKHEGITAKNEAYTCDGIEESISKKSTDAEGEAISGSDAYTSSSSSAPPNRAATRERSISSF